MVDTHRVCSTMEGAEYMSADTQTQCTVYAISAASRPMTVTAATSLGSSRRRPGPFGPDGALPPACARSQTRVKRGRRTWFGRATAPYSPVSDVVRRSCPQFRKSRRTFSPSITAGKAHAD